MYIHTYIYIYIYIYIYVSIVPVEIVLLGWSTVSPRPIPMSKFDWNCNTDNGGYNLHSRMRMMPMRGWRNAVETVLFESSNSMKSYPSAFHTY